MNIMLDDITESLESLIEASKQAGLSIEELSSLLSSMQTTMQFSAEETGKALKAFCDTWRRPTEEDIAKEEELKSTYDIILNIVDEYNSIPLENIYPPEEIKSAIDKSNCIVPYISILPLKENLSSFNEPLTAYTTEDSNQIFDFDFLT